MFDAGRSKTHQHRAVPAWRTAWIAVVSYHLLFLAGFAALGSYPNPSEIFNADTLFLQDFAQDIYRGGDSRDWLFPVAPFIFPDAVLSFPAAAVGWNHPPLYLAVYGYLQIAIGLAGVGLIAGSLPGFAVLPRRRRIAAAVTAAAGAGCLYWLIVAFFTLTHWPLSQGLNYSFLQAVLPQAHGGTFAWSLVCFGLFLHWRRRPLTIAGTGTLLVCLTLGCAGNALFLVTTVAPIVFALAVAQALSLRPFVGSGRWLKWWQPITAAVVFFLGRWVSEVVPHAPLSHQANFSQEAVSTAWDVFAAGVRAQLLAGEPTHLVAVLGLAAFAAWLFALPRRVTRRQVPAELSLVLLFAAAAILTPLSLVLGGNSGLSQMKDYVWSMKYLLPTFVAPILGAYLLLWSRGLYGRRRAAEIAPSDSLHTKLLVGALTAAVAAGIFILDRTHTGAFGYCPPLVADLKAHPELQGVERYFADFWPTRLINLFAGERYRASPVISDLSPFHWLSNRTRIEVPETAEQPYAVLLAAKSGTPEAQRQLCQKKLGPPVKTVVVNDEWTAYVYGPWRRDTLKVYYIENANYGFQTMEDGGKLSWLGHVPARFLIHSPTQTECVLSVRCRPGPGLPSSDRRKIRVTLASGNSYDVEVQGPEPRLEIPLLVPAGKSHVELLALDEATHPMPDRLHDRNRTRGALMVALTDFQIRERPAGIVAESGGKPAPR